MTTTDAFRVALRAAGLDYAGPIEADGRLHRFKADGDGARNSWYVLHAGPPPAGAFGCWRRNFNETWCDKNGGAISKADWQAIRQHWTEAARQRELTEAAAQEKARRTAEFILGRCALPDKHAYLASKGVAPCAGLRLYRGALVAPLRDAAGLLHSLQFIGPDGQKRFLRGGRVQGCFFTVDKQPDGALVICEGLATGASIQEATGLATVAAMNAGNLLAVAESLRAKWPAREFILAADSDQWTPGNPGLTKAREAAKAIDARLAVPLFQDVATQPTDFNDLATFEGLAEVKRQIDGAAVPRETDEEAYARLAALTPADYDRARKAEAKKLGVRTETLDAAVHALRAPGGDSNAQGTEVDLPDVEPWPDEVDGAEVLADVAEAFCRYLALPDGAADALALWTAHAHAYEAFIHSPRLNAFSPEKGCGKTLLLDVLASLVPRPLRTESLTAAVLFRLVEQYKPTLLLDEVDTYLGDAEELRGLLNAGHRRGARAYRCEGESNTVRGFNAYAPAALAGIGALPGTLHDRSVVVRLVRAKPGEVSARFDSRRTQAEAELCRKLARWTADNADRLAECDPALPAGAFNRMADNWRPLFAVAEVAGGAWLDRAAAAFAKLTTGDDLDAHGIGTLLLADIAATFATAGTDRLPSVKLASALCEIEGRPWAEWGRHNKKPMSPNQLANQLRKFGVAPRNIRFGDETPKGYALADFSEAFERFLPKDTGTDRHNATTAGTIGFSSLSEPPQEKQCGALENAVSTNNDGPCGVVAFQKPVSAENAAFL